MEKGNNYDKQVDEPMTSAPAGGTASCPKRRKRWWKTALKAVAWTVVSVAALIALALCLVVWILTPERLTPIVNEAIAPYIDGRVKVGRVELTVWSTFPNARVDVDSVLVISNGLKGHRHPADADSLLSFDHFHGGIDLARLGLGKIHLTDVELRAPMVNAVSLNDSINNFSIFISAPDTTASEPLTTLPDVSVERLAIVAPRGISFRALHGDSVNCMSFRLDGKEMSLVSQSFKAPLDSVRPAAASSGASGDGSVYRFSIKDFNVNYGDSALNIKNFTFATDGCITWNHRRPFAIALDGFTIGLNGLTARLSTAIDASKDVEVSHLDLQMPATPLTRILAAVPSAFLPSRMPEVKSTMQVAFAARLTKPYNVTSGLVPSAEVKLSLLDGNLHIGHDIHVDNLGLDLTATIDGDRLDASKVTLSRFEFRRLGTQFGLTGTVTRLVSDPYIDGTLRGRIDFNRLPPRLVGYIPGRVRGLLVADSEFRFALSDLDPNRFHHVKATGTLGLHNFTYRSVDTIPTTMFVRHAEFRLGTNEAFTTPDKRHRIDSLLTASFKADTLAVDYADLHVSVRNLKAGVGCFNTPSVHDTTQVNPIGGSLRFDRLTCSGSDSSRILMRGISAQVSLHRYKGDRHRPELSTRLMARRVSYRDRINRMSLREGLFAFKVNLKPPRKRKPGQPRLMRTRYEQRPDNAPELQRVTMGFDSTTRRLIRRLDLRGTIRAKSGRMMTPYFPLRNRIENFNMDFTADSLQFHDVKYKAGNSDFLLNGSISNINRFLTSRRGADLRVRFSSKSHIVDVNQLSLAIFSGAAFGERDKEEKHDLTSVSDEDMEAVVEATASDSTMALIVPMNIDAAMRIEADSIRYTNIALRDFRGELLMRNGAINLNRLLARTDVGDASLTALYMAPTKQDIHFGFGMQLKNVDLKEAIGLIPHVDSLMPLLKSMEGIVNADVAATTQLDSMLNFNMPTLNAAIKLSGDSLVLMDSETFRTVAKWMLFKNKQRNLIDHMSVEMLVKNSTLQLYPFMFDMDRYRLGVMGYNDLALNLHYHVSVLKSPLPFKFGINIGGNVDKMKIRLGRAKFKEGMAGQSVGIVDTTRVNLINEIEQVFRRGARAGRLEGLRMRGPQRLVEDTASDTLSHADSLELIKRGILPPDTSVVAVKPAENPKSGAKNKRKKKK